MTMPMGNVSYTNSEDFLAWHRWFLLSFEKELEGSQSVTGAAKIQLPYWDWTSQYYTSSPQDNSKVLPLWSCILAHAQPSMLHHASLGRTTCTAEVLRAGFSHRHDTADARRVYLKFLFLPAAALAVCWRAIRTTPVTGGLEAIWFKDGRRKTRSFSFITQTRTGIWQYWTNIGNTTVYADSNFSAKSPGTTVPNFPNSGSLNVAIPQTLTQGNLTDSRNSDVKVWYAENGTVILDKYTASGTENYYYTGIIEAGSRVTTTVTINSTTKTYSTGNFTIPSGATVKFVSGGLQMGTAPAAGSIHLVPGFSAQSGSTFRQKLMPTTSTMRQ